MARTIFCLLLLLWTSFLPAVAKSMEIMLPEVYEESRDISGWLVSEKLDGVRGYWDGTTLRSKNGTPFQPPAGFLRNFPGFAMEGEIWGGRGTFETTVAAVKRQTPHNGWLELKFAVFDVPGAEGPFSQRIQKAIDWFAAHPADHAFVIPQRPVRDREELRQELARVEKLGGEGLMVRRPDAHYTKGRSRDILKVKSYRDMEARVVGHLPGAGRNSGRLGALLVELPNGRRCRIGTGFTDKERGNPPPLGATVTFKYYGFHSSGLPKFPSYLRVREEP